MNNIERMKELITEIAKHNYNYYVLDNPTISDYQYDLLYDELIELENVTKVVLPDSPTSRVGGETLKGFEKYIHTTPLFSLEKCTSIDKLYKWVNNIKDKYSDAEFTLEYKFDGLTIVVEYNNGYLVSAGTRGNGTLGENVTSQVKTIKNIPLSIPYKKHLKIAGECIMTKTAFDKYNRTAVEKLKNPRNAAAGALRNLDPKITSSRNLSATFYSILEIDDKLSTQKEIFEFMVQNNFPVDKFFSVNKSADQIIPLINNVDKMKEKLDILIDGVVIKLNQFNYRNELGYTAKHPKWALAFKFEAQELATKLLDVKWQVGRTGKLTPIALLDPIELAGATVSRATLNNYNDILKKNISINSSVFVRRSNEVIPEVVGLAEKAEDANNILPPSKCPSCGESVTEIGANIFCLNHSKCIEQITDRLTHFVSRDAMNIVGFSEKTILQLNKVYEISQPHQIYTLTNEMLSKLEGFKQKKISNILNSIEASKSVNYSNFIYALGILLVGKKTAYVLSKQFDSIDKLKNATLEQLTEIRDIGDIVAKSIIDYFSDNENIKNMELLFSNGVEIIYPTNKVKNTYFNGKKIVLTGSLQNYKRNDLTEILQNLGADVLNSVSKNTDIVIAGSDAGSKLFDAQRLNIKIIDEMQLLDLLKINVAK